MITTEFKTTDSLAQIEVWEMKASLYDKIKDLNNEELKSFFKSKSIDAKVFFNAKLNVKL